MVNLQPSETTNNLTTSSPVLEHLPALENQLAEVEELTMNLRKLLIKFENTLVEEGIRKQIETLERWTESYRRGLSAAKKISETGLLWLAELRDHLILSSDEMSRFEEEGGNPLTQEQAKKAEALLKAKRSLDKVIPIMEHVFGNTDTPNQNTSS